MGPKKLIIFILCFLFFSTSFVFAKYVETITTTSTVYGIYSDHYDGSIVIDNSETLTLEDDIYIWANGYTQYGLSDITESFEGDNVLGFWNEGTSPATIARFGFAYNEESNYSRFKDMSDFGYIMVSLRFDLLDPGDNYYFAFGGKYVYPTLLGEGDGGSMPVFSTYGGNDGPSSYVTAQGPSTSEWVTIVVSTTQYNDKTLAEQAGKDFDFARLHNFFFAGFNATYYADNCLFFKDIATDIVFSTQTITTIPDIPLLVYVDAVDSAGRLSAMPPPAWSVTGGISSVKDGYSAYFKSDTAGAYTISATTGVWNPNTSTFDVISGSLGVTVLDTPDWSSKFQIYTDYVNKGELKTFATEPVDGTTLTLSTTSVSTEGSRGLNFACSLINSSSYAGLYFLEESPSRDLTAFVNADYCILQFDIKTDVDVEISVKSSGLDDETHKAKIKLSDLGIPLDNTWQTVKVSVKDFKLLEPNLDFSDITIPLLLSVVGIAGSHDFVVDNIRWFSTANVPSIYSTSLKNISDDSAATTMTWTVASVPTKWVVSDQYLAIDLAQYDHDEDASWGLQVYTDNASFYTGDSDPAGLVKDEDGGTARVPLLMAWLVSAAKLSNLDVVENRTATSSDIYLSTSTGVEFYPWHWIKDKDTDGFENAAISINVYDETKGFHFASGDNDYPISSVDGSSGGNEDIFKDEFYMYIATDFSNVESSTTYKTNLILERYTE